MNTDERINELGKDINATYSVLLGSLVFIIIIFLIVLGTAKSMQSNNNDISISFFNGTNTSFDGLYLANYGFLVDTRGHSLERISAIVDHETLHALIRQNQTARAHFCGDVKE